MLISSFPPGDSLFIFESIRNILHSSMLLLHYGVFGLSLFEWLIELVDKFNYSQLQDRSKPIASIWFCIVKGTEGLSCRC
jgi:hypothetical protein